MCRHPLYLFSIVAVAGFGLMLQSLLVALLLTVLFGGALYYNALREEERLRRVFGPAYAAYARTTPALLPAVGRFHTDDEVTFDVDQLRQNFWDATVFIMLIPLAEVLEWGHSLPGMPGISIP